MSLFPQLITAAQARGGVQALSCCLALVLLALAAGARAAPGPSLARYDFPAQPLAAALAAYGRLTGASVLVASQLTADRRAAALSGEYAPREAMQALLRGTGLEARYIGANALTLVAGPGEPAPGADARPEAAPAGRLRLGAYAAVVQRGITRALCLAQPEAFGRYRIALQLWIDGAGRVYEARLLEPSGAPARDEAVLRRLRQLAFEGVPPDGLPQPVTVLLAPRADPRADPLADCGAAARAG